MKGSIDLVKIVGIDIKIHVTFLLLPALFAMTHGLKGIVFILCVFFCVALHELSHSLQARRYGTQVESIMLLPIGGIASMRDMPHTPKQEFLISISGPLFNFAVGAILFFPMLIVLGRDTMYHPSLATWPQTFAYIFWINPWLGVFNMLPAFPMDGGRVLRSVLAERMDYLKATKIAVSFGHGFALFFALTGIFANPPNFILLIIALFIYMAASQEELKVDLQMTLKNFTVSQVLPKEFLTTQPTTTIGEILEMALYAHQEDFPVVENGVLVGFLDRSHFISSIREGNLAVSVGGIMRKDFPVAQPYEMLTAAYHKMEAAGLKSLPVVQEGSLRGVISLEDISRVYTILSGKKA
ncbi:MAG: site-2 protease family protein [Candidatus Omnitrophica bacterium]|nr:site-2 protease family protein [Candidatus Omnitrophota bacterium]